MKTPVMSLKVPLEGGSSAGNPVTVESLAATAIEKPPPLVSILIPAHNAEKWIAAAIRSAMAQTWERKEIIVVDDGSATEHSKSRASSYVQSFASSHGRIRELQRLVTMHSRSVTAIIFSGSMRMTF